MLRLEDALSRKDLSVLIGEVIHAYEPRTNLLDLSQSTIVKQLRCAGEHLLARNLRYFRAYIFLVSATTIETAQNNLSGGWHIDGTSNFVNGDCFNFWLPIYNSSVKSGLEVISAMRNESLYRELDGYLNAASVLVRPNANKILEHIGVDCTSDFAFLFDDNRKLLEFPRSELLVDCVENASLGSCVVFKQNEFHRGNHSDGIRIQLSLKFVDSAAQIKRQDPEEITKILSKHGRLESQLIRELLKIQTRMLEG